VSHDLSIIILICRFDDQETFMIINIVENSCAASYFLWKPWYFFSLIKKFKAIDFSCCLNNFQNDNQLKSL